MTDCIFCKIASGKIPSEKIYEDDKVIAFLDIAPVSKGHALLVPKQHYERIEDVPKELLNDVINVIKMISPSVINSVNANSFNLLVNNGKEAGQIVPHLHFHIVPRFKDDGLKLWPQKKYTEGEAEKIAEKIRNLLK